MPIPDEKIDDPLAELRAWRKTFVEKLKESPSIAPTNDARSEAMSSDAIREEQSGTNESKANYSMEESLNEMKKLQAWLKVYAESGSYPGPVGESPTRLERLENEIVELKKEMVAKDATMKKLEQRIAKLEAVQN
ncbi:hypothetical protein L0337_27780 [candidate division KSB1 bacterium]|nr:hypothetical protein [candidate division KSB1 bacterium]